VSVFRLSFAIRLYLVYLLFLGAAAGILSHLFVLQVRDHAAYLLKAESQQRSLREIAPERGDIFFTEKDGSLEAAAVNKDFPYVYVVPDEIQDQELTTSFLAETLGMPRDAVRKRVEKRGDPYELVARRVSDDTARAIRSAALPGVYVGSERLRFYPQRSLAAHVIGFARLNDSGTMLKGEYGIEAGYHDILSGTPGTAFAMRNAGGNAFFEFHNALPKDGASILLTIDPNVQFKAEEILSAAAAKWSARSGTAIVLDASTGKILAMANYPSFDPNEYAKEKDFSVFMNHAIASRFEPGSVFKAITMAIALEKGVITPDTTYHDTGAVTIGVDTIRNADRRAHGIVTMTKVLEESYNTGAVFAEQKIGNEAFRDFLAWDLALQDKTGIDLPGEVGGDLSGLFPPDARPINFATASFGQGIATTPIKLVEIFGAFANGGTLIQPSVVAALIQPDGTVTKRAPVIVAKNVFSARTLEALTKMLVEVIESGTGRAARIAGYTIAGKTGTAQVPHPNGRGYSSETIHTFAAYTPFTNPPFVVFMKLDAPKGVRYAEGSVVPATRELLAFILQYYGIPPDRTL
jgi:cell division protein FtsI/penicillin-binding protein 2